MRVVADLARNEADAALDRRARSCTVEIEQANRELESFSYSVSHDLRAVHRYASRPLDGSDPAA